MLFVVLSFVLEIKGKRDEWLVFDTVGQMDGLERLIVICVGLDAPIDAPVSQKKNLISTSPATTATATADTDVSENDASDSAPTSSIEMKTRSSLYRAITRAHLMVVVVNAFIKGKSSCC